MFVIKLDKRNKTPYYIQIKESIKHNILTGQIKDGMRMPKIDDVAHYFHISKIAVTHAYDILSKEGMLIKIKGKGTFVKYLPKMILPIEVFYDVNYFFNDIIKDVKREAHLIELEDQKTIVKFTTYIKNHPMYHQDIIIFSVLDVDVQKILDQPISLFKVFFQMNAHETLYYHSHFQSKNADFQDAIILDIKENDPLIYITTEIYSNEGKEAVVKTYYPSEFVTIEASI